MELIIFWIHIFWNEAKNGYDEKDILYDKIVIPVAVSVHVVDVV